MIQEDKNDRRIEVIQNWGAFGLMAIGIALAVGGYAWALYVIGIGVVSGLFFIVKRTLPNRLSIFTIISILCCVYVPLSFWLLITFPFIYGQELDALFTWSIWLIGTSLAAMVFTSIELFRISKS